MWNLEDQFLHKMLKSNVLHEYSIYLKASRLNVQVKKCLVQGLRIILCIYPKSSSNLKIPEILLPKIRVQNFIYPNYCLTSFCQLTIFINQISSPLIIPTSEIILSLLKIMHIVQDQANGSLLIFWSFTSYNVIESRHEFMTCSCYSETVIITQQFSMST